jgi:hypothetical protein
MGHGVGSTEQRAKGKEHVGAGLKSALYTF